MDTCQECGKEFTKKHRQEKYCSDWCRTLVDRKTCKRYKIKHKDKIAERRKQDRPKINKYHKEFYHTHPGYRDAHNHRRRLQLGIKNKKFNKILEGEIGCTYETFESYMNPLMKPGMTWDNYGKPTTWNIDHIKPFSSFDLNSEEERKKCYNYKNLQPLWWDENSRKGKYVKMDPKESN